MTSTTSTSTTPTSTTGSPKTSRRLVAALVAGGVALAGITAAVTMTLATPEAHAQPAVTTSSSSTSSSHGSAGGHTSHSHAGHHTAPVVPWSQSTKTLQSQLAQLNYYDGHITGYWNAATTDAVTYLQASAHLPQTGTMNAATQAALDYQLVHGDNQMGS